MKLNHIFTEDTVFRISHDLRNKDKVVGLTHGAYDLFHYGHLAQLKESAMHCDFLIVGIDTDEAIRIYKDEYRPIIPLKERLEIISSISFVDAVFVKDQVRDGSLEPLEDLYNEIRPSFVSIGRNPANEEYIKESVYRANSELYKFDSVVPPRSTTAIIDKIIAQQKRKWEEKANKVKPPVVERL